MSPNVPIKILDKEIAKKDYLDMKRAAILKGASSLTGSLIDYLFTDEQQQQLSVTGQANPFSGESGKTGIDPDALQKICGNFFFIEKNDSKEQ